MLGAEEVLQEHRVVVEDLGLHLPQSEWLRLCQGGIARTLGSNLRIQLVLRDAQRPELLTGVLDLRRRSLVARSLSNR